MRATRRGFIAAAPLTWLMRRLSVQDKVVTESTPDADDRPEKIGLARGLALTDYRYVEDSEGTFFIGEYKNETDEMRDAPVLGITFYDAEGNIVGDGTATPLSYVIDDGQSLPLRGAFFGADDFNPGNDEWDRAEYFICGEWAAGLFTERFQALDVELEDVEET